MNKRKSIFSVLLNFNKSRPPRCSVVIAAAGSSERMNGEDKLFLNICGVPVLAYTLSAFERSDRISEIIIVTRESKTSRVSEICGEYGISKAKKIVIGGGTRLESVLKGVRVVSKKTKLIAVHDGARPCITQKIITNTIDRAAKYHAAAPGIPITSTIKKVKDGVIVKSVDREGLVEIQTPQIFDADLIKAALCLAANENADITDDCQAVEKLGFPIHVTEGSRDNIKLTTSEDIQIAEGIFLRRRS